MADSHLPEDQSEYDQYEGVQKYEPVERVRAGALHADFEAYKSRWAESVADPAKFWGEEAKKLKWLTPFTTVQSGGFEAGDVAWFRDGTLNVSDNCLDRHLEKRGDQVAIIHEGDEPGQVRKLTYRKLHQEVCKTANLFKHHGVRKGDTVAIYMPMTPELAIAMLACTRIGAVHSIVFAGKYL